MEKERFNVRVDSQRLKEFKLAVLDKYGGLYGSLGKATEEALGLWISAQEENSAAKILPAQLAESTQDTTASNPLKVPEEPRPEKSQQL